VYGCHYLGQGFIFILCNKILWLLTYDDEKGTYADIVDKYCGYVPPIQWLPWVPQLLTLLVRHDGKMVINLLNSVGRMYPQAVYFPIRTLYLTLKIEQREKVRSAELAVAASTPTSSADGNYDQESSAPNKTAPAQPGEGQAIKATPSMWRYVRRNCIALGYNFSFKCSILF